MRKFKRLEAPEFLSKHSEEWGEAWERRHSADSGAKFYWHEVDKEPVNQKLMPLLKTQTQSHCSFCDNYPVAPPGTDTIEHFRPKATFPKDAYQWSNLYYCCNFCQTKGAAFDEAALHPDAEDYEFDRYFRWDYTKGELRANDLAAPEDQNRADATIKLYHLNKEHPSLRLRTRHRWPSLAKKGESLDDQPYRDFLS
jgi:uncharacterized protein (TIGR02646 family)